MVMADRAPGDIDCRDHFGAAALDNETGKTTTFRSHSQTIDIR
jgi:hypothetical protein